MGSYFKKSFLHLYLVDYYVCFYSSTYFDPLGVSFCVKWWIQVQFSFFGLGHSVSLSPFVTHGYFLYYLLHMFLFSTICSTGSLPFVTHVSFLYHLLHMFLFSSVFWLPSSHLGLWVCLLSLHVWFGAITLQCFWLYYYGSAIILKSNYNPSSTILLAVQGGLWFYIHFRIVFFLYFCEKWHEEFWLDLKIWIGSDLKVSSLGTNFHHIRRCCVSLQRGNQSPVLHGCRAYEPHQWPAWQDSPVCTARACHCSNPQLPVRLKAYSRRDAYLVLETSQATWG